MSDHLKNKISNYEVLPPDGTWNNIAAELHESNELLPLAKRMYDYEVSPPTSAWKNISAILINGTNPVASVPVKSMNSLVVKITAAAAVIGVILIGSLFLLQPATSPIH